MTNSPNPPFDVALAADMCVDLVLAGNVRPRFCQVEQLIGDYSLEIGGSANIFACQMSKLGARAAVIGRVGQDVFGNFLKDRLAQAGVDTRLVHSDTSLKTGLGVSLTEPDDRAILTFLGSIAAVGPDDLPASPAALTRHWHLASFFLLGPLRRAWSGFLERCRQAGVTVSFDPNWDPAERWEGVTEILPLIDVFLPNEAEAIAVSAESNVIAAGRALSSLGPLVVIKRGDQGAMAFRGDRCWTLRPDEEPLVVDAIGAGDNFDAGFLCGWLSGQTVEASLDLGHHCATASLASAGGISGQLKESRFAGRPRETGEVKP